MNYHLAIDIGASSGRHILGCLEGGRLVIEEVHRFSNGPREKNGRLVWDTDALLKEIIAGMKKCAALGKKPAAVGIDTWGVDYVLLDGNDREILPAHAYRDLRTEPFLASPVGDDELYRHTGIQKQSFNTIYQLLADKAEGRLEKAERMLLLPEYFSWKLCGVKAAEYTESSTTGLLNVDRQEWDRELLDKLDLPSRIFGEVKKPGTILGHLLPAIRDEVGFDAEVVLPATHDTASAVLAVPSPGSLYISSGTWSLMGAEGKAITSDEARRLNYTNEGGATGKIRFQKNIMGLWVMQGLRKELGDGAYSFQDLADLAEKEVGGMKTEEAAGKFAVDINDQRFFAPKSMIAELKGQCGKEGKPIPESPAELASCVYLSLAYSYSTSADEIERLTGRKFDHLCIVGGGSKDDLLNKLSAAALKRPVYAGPVEATAIGSIVMQCLARGEIGAEEEAKEIVKDSFEVKVISCD
jgi:rhamnulokinase